ncbi:MAG: non-ribosomal peptide synthetase module [Alkaliphilus sp.]|jgi:regulator of replication initiation timing|nr:non-ribosomal peptide synthetase module [bacterium AH-315-K05]PHS31294.1 MAG: non-ribosomal peptide synthetase module [Alkaliphilus sp.]
MNYSETSVMDAFKIFSQLAVQGECNLIEFDSYMIDDNVRGLVDLFANEVNCTIIVTGEERLLMLPIVMASPFHISNERLKKEFFTQSTPVSDIYLMYFAIIIFYGIFYDSYSTTEPVNSFVSMDKWLEIMNDRIKTLSAHDDEVLMFMQKESSYNWKMIIDKWESMDDTNEQTSRQVGATKSRLSFMNKVRGFLLEQDLVNSLGEMELELTEKSKDIVSKYYMDSEYNRGILELIYQEEAEVCQ